MLQAVLNGKAGRVDLGSQGECVSWKQLYQKREDLLTSAFFNRFAYLSPVIQHRLVQHWFNGVGDFTQFCSIDYWPKYELPDNDKRSFVEPDLLIRFKTFDLLVEVKPPAGGDQYINQWRTEIEGYFAQEQDNKAIYFLAIGRIDSVLQEERSALRSDFKIKGLAAIKWKTVAQHIYQLLHTDEPSIQDKRVLTDMLASLFLYGIRGHDLKWAELENLLPNADKAFEAMSNWYFESPHSLKNTEESSSITFENMDEEQFFFDLESMKKWKM